MTTEHGIAVSNALISSWKAGESAIAGYGEALSQNASAFIGNIMGVENEMMNLQTQANNAANTLAWMLSTKADTLVNELAASHLAESNLEAMTRALHESLVSTLERGYDVGSLVSSINDVSDAFKRMGVAAKDAGHAMAPGSGAPAKGEDAFWLAPGGSKSAAAIQDFQILAKAQADGLFELSKAGPLQPFSLDGMAAGTTREAWPGIRLPLPMPDKKTGDTNLQIGSLVSVQGSVDSTNVKQMETIANKAVARLVERISDGAKYGPF